MTKPVKKGQEQLPATVQTYDRSAEEIAAKLGRKGADPALKEALSQRVREQAREISEFIINRASKEKEKKVAGG